MKSINDKKKSFSMTTCTKTGIKIKNTGNEYKCDPFAGVDPFKNQKKEIDRIDINYNKSQYETIDLNIENYSREELYKLFGFQTSAILTEENLKEAKKIVLKTHPDKSRLDNKYFVFFGKAFQKIKEIYEFQNKTRNKTTDINRYDDKQNYELLDKMFDNKKNLKDSKNFNEWFNDQFEKHKLEDPIENGYGSWLKSDEDIVFTPQGLNKDSMGREIEKRKKEIQTLTPYKGVGDTFLSSSVGGTSLMEYNSNFTSGSLFSGGNMGYTDLRQAYVESVIPVTEEDYNKTQKFKSVDEYKRHRETANVNPISKEESMRQLYYQDKQKDEESAALAFYYAQQSEKVKKNSDNFWSGLKQLTN
jgi:curved DNA-binding protein CbpA